MPIRPLNLNRENLQSLKEWLNENINEKKRIKACCKEVKNVSEKKGIYFWFMLQSCYKKLKNIKALKSIYQREINGEVYHLVYTGTAGVRNNSNGNNNGNLRQRIKWHLCDNKNVSALCSGTMSTFRRTIGSLMADDLIENYIQDKIDELFCENFYIYYLEYPGTFLQVKDEVNSDESVIIDILRPIFNLDENLNVNIPNHISYHIQQRRQTVENSSKVKWCNGKKPKSQAKSNGKRTPPPKGPNVLISAESVRDNKGCVEFKVTSDQNISQVAQAAINLPLRQCTIEIFSNNRADVRTYINGRIRKTSRSVSEYLDSPDTANENLPRWKIVQAEMNNKKKIIEIITVRVCPIKLNKGSIKPPTNNKIIHNYMPVNFEKIKDKNKKKLLIIGCSGKKLSGGDKFRKNYFETYDGVKHGRNVILEKYSDLLNDPKPIDYFNKKREGVLVDNIYFNNQINNNLFLPALERYSGGRFFTPTHRSLYYEKNKHSNLHILIISGLYGILEFRDSIIDYQLDINKFKVWNNSNIINQTAKKYIDDNGIDKDLVFYSLSPTSYEKALKPDKAWHSLWIKRPGGRSVNTQDSADYLVHDFLPNL